MACTIILLLYYYYYYTAAELFCPSQVRDQMNATLELLLHSSQNGLVGHSTLRSCFFPVKLDQSKERRSLTVGPKKKATMAAYREA